MVGDIPQSVASHWDVLYIVAAALIAGGIVEQLRRLIRLERSQEELKASILLTRQDNVEAHAKCREDLLDKLVSKSDFKEWKSGRSELWTAIDKHRHAETGEVIRVKG